MASADTAHVSLHNPADHPISEPQAAADHLSSTPLEPRPPSPKLAGGRSPPKDQAEQVHPPVVGHAAANEIPRSDSAGILLQPTPIAVDSAGTAPRLPPIGYTEAPSKAPLDRPLNVTDALSYLDAVKVQFHDQPDVYNHFLDIMKDFKSQIIDTPGVIKRVSYLFNGHPSLIQGFNTFLPVGYCIECSTDAHDSNLITVTTPTGTMMQTSNNGLLTGPMQWSTSQTIPRDALHLPDRVAADDMEDSSSPIADLYRVDGQAMEPAVQYVQKIKQRCDAETYQQFLAILSRYHQSPNETDEVEVSKQIALLFKDAPDLRSDFRIFMPGKSQRLFDDIAAVSPPPPDVQSRTGTPAGDSRSKRKLDSVAGTPSTAAAMPQKRKRRTAEKEKEKEPLPLPAKIAASSKVKKVKHSASQDLTPSSYSHSRHDPGPSTSRRSNHPPQAHASSRAQPAVVENDEHHFFDRVKRALDNRDTYNEFLKLVNLFTQDYIDTAKLVKESRNFLGDGELLAQFKDILGWDERKERDSWLWEQQQQHSWTRPFIGGFINRPSAADMNVKYGSYRRLPASEANVSCTGRDEMCRAVLNDEWVSHPTWTSEDSGFVAHKKNVYEEALHRSEEERHEYDFHIEGIARTILALEAINNKITQLNDEERARFKLKANLHGTGKAVNYRVIKKIYGREAGQEVIQALHDTPIPAIPVVLSRLKQKEVEWKRAQREWNKVWREADARNYQKSLDHQGIAFKSADKKALTTKAFVSQIEAAREEQMAKRASLIDPLFARTRPRHQLEFLMEDVQVLQDALKLTFSFLDRTQTQINFADRKRIEGFLRSFIPLFFTLDPVAFNSAFVVVQETIDSDMSDDTSVADDADAPSASSGSSRRNHRKGVAGSSGGDLRKKLLKSEQAKSTNRKTRAQEAASPSASRLASPAIVDVVDPDAPSARADVPAQTQGRHACRRNTFFTNTVFYTLLRLLEVLYSRLALFKGIATRLAQESPRSNQHQQHPLARELGLPPSTAANKIANAEHYYDLLLESCERLFDNEVEQAAFEDQMRSMFGTKEAYKIFTIDKLIGALIKQVQTVFADAKSQDLLENLKRERALPSPTTQDQINSRHDAEKVLGPDENLFRIDWLSDSKTMTVQLIGKDDSSFDDSEVLTGRWQSYIDSFVSSETTQGVSENKVKSPYLRRNLPKPLGDLPLAITARGGLEIKVCVRTYRLFFVSGTEDVLWRIPSAAERQAAAQRLQVHNAQRRKWLERVESRTLTLGA